MNFETLHIPTVPILKTWETQELRGNFDQRFRKYFQKRSRGRKNGLKRVYNEGDMIFTSLTTKTIF